MGSPFYRFGCKSVDVTNVETSKAAIARGVKVNKYNLDSPHRAKKSNKIDAQKLLDQAYGTKYEKEVIAFLKSQNIDIQG